jgi:hypothetical protein
MDNKQKLIELYDTQDWHGLVKFANQIRDEQCKDFFFGLKKNYFNVIIASSWYYEAIDLMEKMGFCVITGNTTQVLKRIEKGKLKIEDSKNNIAIITKSKTMAGELSRLNFPTTNFELSIIDNYYERLQDKSLPEIETYCLENLDTSEKYLFTEENLKGLIREEKIDSIFED